MNTEMKLHLAKYNKYMDEARNVLVIIGKFDEVLVSQHLYEQRHGISSVANVTRDRLMNACALAAASLADKESWGWTLTLPGSADGFFVGVEPEGMICTRQQPAEPPAQKVYLQRQKARGPLIQSHYEPETSDPVQTVELYFNQVVQTATRIAVVDETGVLVQALPDADFSALEAMDDNTLAALYLTKEANGELKRLQEYLVFYECRCDEEMIYKMVSGLPEQQREDIFSESPQIEIECPRCGRKYTAARNDVLN